MNERNKIIVQQVNTTQSYYPPIVNVNIYQPQYNQPVVYQSNFPNSNYEQNYAPSIQQLGPNYFVNQDYQGVSGQNYINQQYPLSDEARAEYVKQNPDQTNWNQVQNVQLNFNQGFNLPTYQ